MSLVNNVPYCTTCNMELTDNNWFKHFQNGEKKRYWCKKCYYEYYKPYTQKNVTTTIRNGQQKKIFGKKRDKPNGCEICGKSKVNLQYHHLEKDEKIFKKHRLLPGIWICRYCHIYANFIEDGLKDFFQKYEKTWIQAYKETYEEIGGSSK